MSLFLKPCEFKVRPATHFRLNWLGILTDITKSDAISRS
jgi:hypothetical protein